MADNKYTNELAELKTRYQKNYLHIRNEELSKILDAYITYLDPKSSYTETVEDLGIGVFIKNMQLLRELINDQNFFIYSLFELAKKTTAYADSFEILKNSNSATIEDGGYGPRERERISRPHRRVRGGDRER